MCMAQVASLVQPKVFFCCLFWAVFLFKPHTFQKVT